MNTWMRGACAALFGIGLAGMGIPAAMADSTTTTTTTTTTDTPAPPAVVVAPAPGPAEGGCETHRVTRTDDVSGATVSKSRTNCD